MSSTALRLGKPVFFGNWQVAVLSPGEAWPRPIVLPKQTHGGNIVSALALMNDKRLVADGVINEGGQMAAGVITADCLPLVVTSEEMAIVLHVSRKTLIHGLLDNLTSLMDPVAIEHIYVGPHICEYHFTFTEERRELRQFRYRFPKAVHFHKGLIYLSLRTALQQYLEEWHVHPDRVIDDGRCTFERPEMPSYRRRLEAVSEEGQYLTTVVQKANLNYQ